MDAESEGVGEGGTRRPGARFLLDDPVASVWATATAIVDPSIRALSDYDTATVVLESATGTRVSILNSRRARFGYDQRIEVHGSHGMVQAENQRPADIVVATESGFLRPPLHDFFMTRYTEAYAAELAGFIACLKSGAQMTPSGADGLAALELAMAAEASVRSGERVRLG